MSTSRTVLPCLIMLVTACTSEPTSSSTEADASEDSYGPVAIAPDAGLPDSGESLVADSSTPADPGATSDDSPVVDDTPDAAGPGEKPDVMKKPDLGSGDPPPGGGQQGPAVCTTPADCEAPGACLGTMGCSCEQIPNGPQVCLPLCAMDSDCPPGGKKTLVCTESGVCSPVKTSQLACSSDEECAAACPTVGQCVCKEGLCAQVATGMPEGDAVCETDADCAECPAKGGCVCVEGICTQAGSDEVPPVDDEPKPKNKCASDADCVALCPPTVTLGCACITAVGKCTALCVTDEDCPSKGTKVLVCSADGTCMPEAFVPPASP